MAARLFIVSRLSRSGLVWVGFVLLILKFPQRKGKIDHHASFGVTLTGREPSQMVINAFNLIEIYFCEKSNRRCCWKGRD